MDLKSLILFNGQMARAMMFNILKKFTITDRMQMDVLIKKVHLFSKISQTDLHVDILCILFYNYMRRLPPNSNQVCKTKEAYGESVLRIRIFERRKTRKKKKTI